MMEVIGLHMSAVVLFVLSFCSNSCMFEFVLAFFAERESLCRRVRTSQLGLWIQWCRWCLHTFSWTWWYMSAA